MWRLVASLVLVFAVVTAVPFAWIHAEAAGHLHPERAARPGAGGPRADVVLVLGAQVAPGGKAPLLYLRGRLDTAARLVHSGRARVILVSGDAHGASGDETAVMTRYLVDSAGIDPARVVSDPDGLDTYDSCVRARTVFGVDRMLVVTQHFHLPRAVALCRHAGIDALGVDAGCAGCSPVNLPRNYVRDYFACSKAALDVLSDRRPAVASPPSDAVRVALRSP